MFLNFIRNVYDNITRINVLKYTYFCEEIQRILINIEYIKIM